MHLDPNLCFIQLLFHAEHVCLPNQLAYYASCSLDQQAKTDIKGTAIHNNGFDTLTMT